MHLIYLIKCGPIGVGGCGLGMGFSFTGEIRSVCPLGCLCISCYFLTQNHMAQGLKRDCVVGQSPNGKMQSWGAPRVCLTT